MKEEASIKLLLDGGNPFIKKVVIRKQKPGRKSGSGDRTARLNIRCKPELLQVLEMLNKHDWYYKGWTQADLIHAAVLKLALYSFPDINDEEARAIIDKLEL